MGKNLNYFHITKEMIKSKEIFPFHIYVHNPLNGEYSPFLFANCPLDSDKQEVLNFILEKGGILAVDIKQKKTFLVSTGLKKDDIPDLKDETIHELEKSRRMYQHILDDKRKKYPFIFHEEIKKAVQSNNFSNIIEAAHDEILTFQVTTSHTTSLAIFLTEKLLVDDNFTNRVIALTYFLAKQIDMNREDVLGDIVCAAFLHHIGMTQFDIELTQKPHNDYDQRERKTYQKHPGLAQHLLKKINLDINSRTLLTCIEHHERSDGSGFPNNKVEDYLEPSALLLGAVSHLLEYSSGMITGKVEPINSIINNYKNHTFTPGLEFRFGDKIFNVISNMLLNKNVEADIKKNSSNDIKNNDSSNSNNLNTNKLAA